MDFKCRLVTNLFKQNNVIRKPLRLGQQGAVPVRVCRFASHVQLIATGYDNGKIEVK